MSSHFKNIGGSAGKLLSRAQQYTEEVLGQSEKTKYDPEIEELIEAVEKNKVWTERILDQIDSIVHPNPVTKFTQNQVEKTEKAVKNITRLSGEKIEGFIMSKMGQATKDKPNAIEVLAQLMSDASKDLEGQGKLCFKDTWKPKYLFSKCYGNQ